MDLLAKFDVVEIQADSRISESDRRFCEVHQQAYDAARSCFMELAYIWEDVLSSQRNILSEAGTDYGSLNTYLPSHSDLEISTESIREHIQSLHYRFMNTILSHFSSKYHITIDSSIVEETLFPPEPAADYDDYQQKKAARKAYEDKKMSMVFQYKDILNQLFKQLNGHSFNERALYELKEKCHNAAWNTYQNQPEYELKKDTVRLTGFGCSFSTYRSHNPWELSDDTKAILRGLAYYETGDFSVYPASISNLLTHNYSSEDVAPFSNCRKVKQLRMYKNRRVDIKFTTAGYAKEFVSEYLGLVC